MNTSYGTITPAEVIWTLSSLPGLILWLDNLRNARKDLRAVRRLGYVDGRMIWAKFAVPKNAAFAFIEFSFLSVGLVAMSQPPAVQPPSHLSLTGWILTIAMLMSSTCMTFVGIRWRQVSRQLLAAARANLSASVEAENRRIEEAHTPPGGWRNK